MADEQADAQQWHLAIVRDDFHGLLVTEPVQKASIRFQRYLVAVSKSCGDTGTLLQAKSLNYCSRDNQFAVERRVDPHSNCDGIFVGG